MTKEIIKNIIHIHNNTEAKEKKKRRKARRARRAARQEQPYTIIGAPISINNQPYPNQQPHQQPQQQQPQHPFQDPFQQMAPPPNQPIYINKRQEMPDVTSYADKEKERINANEFYRHFFDNPKPNLKSFNKPKIQVPISSNSSLNSPISLNNSIFSLDSLNKPNVLLEDKSESNQKIDEPKNVYREILYSNLIRPTTTTPPETTQQEQEKTNHQPSLKTMHDSFLTPPFLTTPSIERGLTFEPNLQLFQTPDKTYDIFEPLARSNLKITPHPPINYDLNSNIIYPDNYQDLSQDTQLNILDLNKNKSTMKDLQFKKKQMHIDARNDMLNTVFPTIEYEQNQQNLWNQQEKEHDKGKTQYEKNKGIYTDLNYYWNEQFGLTGEKFPLKISDVGGSYGRDLRDKFSKGNFNIPQPKKMSSKPFI